MKYRTEHDQLGSMEIPAEEYSGIHAARARGNFAIGTQGVPRPLIHALGEVKKACALANMELDYLEQGVANAIVQACDEMIAGRFDGSFDLDALQGGAGTSTNMCANEILANRGLEILGFKKGEYNKVHPLHHVNLHQSTNDVYPTAVRVAGMRLLRDLSRSVERLQNAFQRKEKQFETIPTMGRTEWVDAVPITLGRQFSSFADAVSRDRWRTFKCEERLRVVNIGGTAVGNGLTAPRAYVFLVGETLRQQTGLGLSRAENLMDATANIDPIVEVCGITKALATNLIKICRDLRLLHLTGEIILPAVQAGSSIMPGKVNPVILESAIQSAIKAKANEGIVAECASLGTQQINEFMPLVALAFLESLEILTGVCNMLAGHVSGIEASAERCHELMANTPALITAFLPMLGYEGAAELVRAFEKSADNDFRAFLARKLGRGTVDQVLSPENLNALGQR